MNAYELYKTFIHDSPIQDFTFSAKPDDKAKCYMRGKELFIVVEESNSLADWIMNILALKHAGAHIGFRNPAIEIYEKMAPSINNWNIELDKITFIGWSRGGAIARQLSYMMYDDFMGQIRLYTFGEPRSVEAGKFVPQIYCERYVHSIDPVPHLPPYSWGFDHPDDAIYVGGKNNLRTVYKRVRMARKIIKGQEPIVHLDYLDALKECFAKEAKTS